MPIATLYDLFRSQAEKQPDATALLGLRRAPMPYSELFSRAAETAAQLCALGNGRGDRISVVLPNDPEMALAFIASTFAGTCAPLNPQHTAAEYEFYLSDLKARALLLAKAVNSPATAVARKLGKPMLEASTSTDAPAGAFLFSGMAARAPVHGENLKTPVQRHGGI